MAIKYTRELFAEAKAKGIQVEDLIRKENAQYIEDTYKNKGLALVEMAMNEAGFDKYSNMYDIFNYSQSTENNNILFPAYIDTTLQIIRENNSQDIIYPALLAGETTIPSDGWKGIYLDLGDEENLEAMDWQGVEEGAEIPFTNLKTGQKSLRVYKNAIGVRQTYETMRRLTVPLVEDHLSRLARHFGRQNLSAILYTMENGDGNNNAIPDTMKFTTATANKLSKTDLIVNSRKFSDASFGLTADIYLCTGGAFDAMQEIYINSNETQGYAPNKMFTFPQNILNGATVYYVQQLKKGAGDKERMLMLNKANGIRKMVEAGSIISEEDQKITNQTYEYVMSENAIYQKIDARSVAELIFK